MGSWRKFERAVRPAARRIVYQTGAPDLYHRWRNRHGLTVLMFHRVLSEKDPRWASSNPEYTLADGLFRRCLQLLKQHFQLIGLPDLLAAEQRCSRLPERPLLVTLDDGWSDNETYALPVLRDEGVRGCLFVVSDTVGSPGLFWQELLYGAWRTGRLPESECSRLWRCAAGDGAVPRCWRSATSIEALIGWLIDLDAATRHALLADLPPDLLPADTPFLVTAQQLRHLALSGVDIGSHGRTHEPLDDVSDLNWELSGSRRALAELLPDGPEQGPHAISYPHGRYTPETVQATWRAGYTLAFTSHECINRPESGRYSRLLGRIGVSSQDLTDATGRFCPERLALRLFRAPHGHLAEDSYGLAGCHARP